MTVKLPFLLLFSGIVVLSACRTTIEPTAPVVTEQRAPLPEQPLSTLVLPISVKLTDYYKMADEQVPYTFDGGEQHCEDVSYSYHFVRDPMVLSANERSVDIKVSGKYRIKMNYCPSCTDLFSDDPHCVIPRIYFSCGYGEPMRRMKLGYHTDIELTPDYGLSTTTKLTELKAIDPCEVTVFAYDATDQLLTEVRKSLQSLAKDIDKQLSGISFKKEATQLWKEAATPIEIPGYGYISMQPVSIKLTNPLIQNNVLNTTLILEARPNFTTAKPVETNVPPLPPLHITPTTPGDTLELFADLHLSYDSISSLSNRYVKGTKLTIKKKDIILDSVRIAGASDQKLVFKVGFSGDKKGILYITGKPVFNKELQQIELTETDFDIDTKSALLNTAEWLFSDKILEEITKSSKQDLTPQLAQLIDEINKSLLYEYEGFTLSGKVSELLVDQVYPETDRLIVRVAARGTLQLTNIKN